MKITYTSDDLKHEYLEILTQDFDRMQLRPECRNLEAEQQATHIEYENGSGHRKVVKSPGSRDNGYFPPNPRMDAAGERVSVPTGLPYPFDVDPMQERVGWKLGLEHLIANAVTRGVARSEAEAILRNKAASDPLGVPAATKWQLFGELVQERLVREGCDPGIAKACVADRTEGARIALRKILSERAPIPYSLKPTSLPPTAQDCATALACAAFVEMFERGCGLAGGGSWEEFKGMPLEQAMPILAMNGFQLGYMSETPENLSEWEAEGKVTAEVLKYLPARP